MTTITNRFEGGTNGTTITTANSGGTSGTAFDAVSIVASGTDAFDSAQAAHGTLSAKIATAATSGIVYNGWDAALGSGQGQVWFRTYLFFTANPAATVKPLNVLTGPAGTVCASMQVSTGGLLQMLDKNGAQITISTTTIPLNAWFRVEGFVIGSATVGQTELKLFTSPDSTSPAETDTSSAVQNTNGGMGAWRFGQNTSRANSGPYWMDDLGLSNTGYVGPASVSNTSNPVLGVTPAFAATLGRTAQPALTVTPVFTPFLVKNFGRGSGGTRHHHRAGGHGR